MKLVLILLLLAGCAGTAPIDPAKLTPREVLYSIEVGYAKALNAEAQIAPTLPQAAKDRMLTADSVASRALDVADVAVLNTASTPDEISAAVAAAQSALQALEAIITSNGGSL